MEKYSLEADIDTMYMKAESFPDGVLKAHQQLHGVVPRTESREYFGISFPNPEGSIIYRAAASETTDGEAAKFGLETYLIKKGQYACVYITDFMTNIQAIGKAFEELIAYPGIDPQGACIEWYINDNDVRCMVRLAD